MNEWINNILTGPKVNDPWPGFAPKTIRLEKPRSVPRYGYDPLRWLFRRPKYWDVTYVFTTQPSPAKG